MTSLAPPRRAFTVGFLPVLALLVACSGSEPPPPEPTTVTISPGSATLNAVGDTRGFSASVRDQDGDPMPNVTISWASSASGVASVDGSGTVTAVSNGSATIRATAGSASATASVTVAQVAQGLDVDGGGQQTAVAGSALAQDVSVRALDRNGNPAQGVEVSFDVTAGGGSVNPTDATTNANGRASTRWTLGPVAGATNTLTATVVGGSGSATFSATAITGPADNIEVVSGGGQFAPRGNQLAEPIVVRVTDALDNPVEGLQVDFTVAGGGGSVVFASDVTDSDGEATTQWILGTTLGTQTLRAQAAGITRNITAQATASPASILVSNGQGQTATVNSVLPVAPAVFVSDAVGQPVPGASVRFTVTSGGGTITAPSGSPAGTEAQALSNTLVVLTDLSGIAAVGSWQLGTVSGVNSNTLRAEVSGLGSVNFSASSTPDTPNTLGKLLGDNQVGTVNEVLPIPVSVIVTDQFNNPVQGITVTFTPNAGAVSAGTVVTGGNGQAATNWTLSSTLGTQTLNASATGLPNVTFTATAQAPGGAPVCSPGAGQSGFNIQLCFITTVSSPVQTAFANAAARWSQLITGDLPAITFSVPAADCGSNSPAVSGTFDDLVILVTVEPIDGPFNVLGSAGPCYVRTSDPNTRFPFLGRMRFDEADMTRLLNQGDLENVILHEMGHVLGIGTLWDSGPYDFLQNPTGGTANSSLDTHFNGAQAIAAFDAAGGAGRTSGSKVPVENAQGGSGTLDGHWRETTMDTELMTGFLDSGVTNPLSAISVASLADMGYTVNLGAADSYTVTNPNGAPRAEGSGSQVELVGDILLLPIYGVDAQGNVVRLIRR